MAEVASSTPLSALDAVVLDTETTGLDPGDARIVQIGAVRIVRGKVNGTERLDQLVNPHIPIPAASTGVHHIEDGDVAGAPDFAQVHERLEGFRAGAPVIGHSISFDLTVLENECRRAGLGWSAPRALDTLVLARLAGRDLADYSLETIAAWLGVEVTGRHSAIGDALTTANVFVALVPRLRERGIRTFAEAESAYRAAAEAMAASDQAGGPPLAPGAGARAPIARIDSFPYRHRVRDVMSGSPLFVDRATTIAETARFVGERGTSSAFVRAGPGSAIGIVTERDLMRALARNPGTGSAAVETIMSAPVIAVDADAFVYRAIARMARAGIRHLAVTDNAGEIGGAVTTGDLLRQRAQAALVMGDEIDFAPDIATLAAAWSRLPAVVHNMLAEDIGSDNITAVIAEELAALTRRAGELAAEAMRETGRGEAPAPYSLLILGSAGRHESRLSPDQDNALVYDAEDDDPAVDDWFAAFGEHLARMLDDAGVPLCKGGVMAKNREWRHSLAGWKREVDGWTTGFEDRDLLSIDIFFDFRPVLGDDGLALALWDYAHDRARSSRGFLKSLAALTTDVRSPIGLFGRIATDNGRVDLKLNGLFAIVGAARALAIRHDVRRRASSDRLEGVKALGVVNGEEIDNLLAAHEILSREILRQQLIDIEDGVPASTRLELARLTRRERDDLRWALEQVNVARMLVGGGSLG